MRDAYEQKLAQLHSQAEGQRLAAESAAKGLQEQIVRLQAELNLFRRKERERELEAAKRTDLVDLETSTHTHSLSLPEIEALQARKAGQDCSQGLGAFFSDSLSAARPINTCPSAPALVSLRASLDSTHRPYPRARVLL